MRITILNLVSASAEGKFAISVTAAVVLTIVALAYLRW